MHVTLESRSPEETRALGERIGRRLASGAIVFLSGELGSGKTLMAKGLHAGTGGADPDQVLSPSYTMVNVYEDGPRPCYHVDLYRLTDLKQLLAMEYEDFLLLNEGLTLVEWPDLARELVEPGDLLDVRFEPADDMQHRRITVTAEGERYRDVMKELGAC